MKTKQLKKTESEKLYIDYLDVFNKLEIQLQFDLRDIFLGISLYSKIILEKSLLMYNSNNILNIYVSPHTLNYYVTLDNGDWILFNVLPITTRYKIYKYLLNLKDNGTLKDFVYET